MLRFVLLTCWLVGAGGGWGLGLAGLNAMGTGAGSFAELIVLGGASSWAAMLVTALRPGKRPNIWQRIFTVLAWLMPVGMFMLGDTFNMNVRLFSLAAAACVTMIVIIYPSQSPQMRLDEGRRLALHLRKQEAEQKAQEKAQAKEEQRPRADGAQVSDAMSAAVGTGSQAAAPVADGAPMVPASPSVRGHDPERTAKQASPERAADPDAFPTAEPGSGSRWQAPQVRRRGKLRDDRTGSGRLSQEDREL